MNFIINDMEIFSPLAKTTHYITRNYFPAFSGENATFKQFLNGNAIR